MTMQRWYDYSKNPNAPEVIERLGVDVLEEEVRYLQTKGKVICADVTKAPIAEKFDVIIAGEVLEHLDATGMFMKNCATMLNFGGRAGNYNAKSVVCQCLLVKKTFRFFYLRG